jgi:hypothetical protein
MNEPKTDDRGEALFASHQTCFFRVRGKTQVCSGFHYRERSANVWHRGRFANFRDPKRSAKILGRVRSTSSRNRGCFANVRSSVRDRVKSAVCWAWRPPTVIGLGTHRFCDAGSGQTDPKTCRREAGTPPAKYSPNVTEYSIEEN